jgi:hypothetical protein
MLPVLLTLVALAGVLVPAIVKRGRWWVVGLPVAVIALVEMWRA